MKIFPLLLAFVSTSCLANAELNVEGSYELLVCKSTCSFENPKPAIARGTVVLLPTPLSQTNVKKLDPFHFGEPYETIRACFAGETFKDAQTFAFTTNTGAMSWSLQGKVVAFSLMRSIDAGYSAEVELKDNMLLGKGISWGAGVAAAGYAPDLIVGRRIGPANIEACANGSVQSPPN